VNEATGASILMPGGDAGGTYLAGPNDMGHAGDDNCFPGIGSSQVDASWATGPQIGRSKLVVLRACFTLKPTFNGTDGRPLTSIGQEAFDAGAPVVTGVFTTRPGPPQSGLTDAALLQQAQTFAAAKVRTFGQLTLYQSARLDHGAERLFTATWRERRGSAWLPMLVTVSVDEAGRPAEFAYNPTVVGNVDTTLVVGAAAAGATAAGVGGSVTGPPELDVLGPPAGPPRLVWIVNVTAGKAPQDPTVVQILVDARTGTAITRSG